MGARWLQRWLDEMSGITDPSAAATVTALRQSAERPEGPGYAALERVAIVAPRHHPSLLRGFCLGGPSRGHNGSRPGHDEPPPRTHLAVLCPLLSAVLYCRVLYRREEIDAHFSRRAAAE